MQSIHADIAYTLGDYLYKKITSSKKEVTMGVMNLVVTKGLVAQSNLKVPQLVEVTISTNNVASGQAALEYVDGELPIRAATHAEPIAASDTAEMPFAFSTDPSKALPSQLSSPTAGRTGMSRMPKRTA